MEPYMEKAWDCLTEQEQNSLFLMGYQLERLEKF